MKHFQLIILLGVIGVGVGMFLAGKSYGRHNEKIVSAKKIAGLKAGHYEISVQSGNAIFERLSKTGEPTGELRMFEPCKPNEVMHFESGQKVIMHLVPAKPGEDPTDPNCYLAMYPGDTN